MSNDWAAHKAEIKKLHIDEGRSVEEVRDILKARHGFRATTRAYRVRIDQWTLRKYRTRKERTSQANPVQEISPSPIPASTSSVGSSSSPTSQSLDTLFSEAGILLPSRQMKASEVLSLIQGPQAIFWAVEVLLWKWQPGGEYLKALTQLLQDQEHRKHVMRCTDDGRPLLFQLIEDLVPSEEQPDVGKILLHADLSVQHLVNDPHPDAPWLLEWHAACQATNLDDAKELLFDEENVISSTAGHLFLDCARVVIAERLLQRLIKRIRLLGLDSDLPSIIPDDPNGPNEVEMCRRSYLKILAEFHHSTLNLHPSFYKHALEILGEGNGQSNKHQSTASLNIQDYRHKYLQLESISDYPAGDFEDFEDSPQNTREGSVDSQVSTHSSLTSGPQSISGLHFATPGPESESRDYLVGFKKKDPQSATRRAVRALLSKWRSLKGFKSFAHEMLIRDGAISDGVFIFESTSSDDNLFDVLREEAQENEMMLFTEALLMTFSTINPDRCYLPDTLKWWMSLYTSPSWEDFQQKIDPKEVEIRLGKAMSPSAVRLVLDATVHLVGERLLGALNAEIAKHPRKDDTRDHMPRNRLQQQYMAILGEFQERDLKVDLSWRSHALNH